MQSITLPPSAGQARSGTIRLRSRPSALIGTALVTVVFFGLCGAFISNLIAASKAHYVPLLVAICIVAIAAVRRSNGGHYLLALAFIAASPLFAAEANDYLSYFSTMVLPIFWFCAGRFISPSQLAKRLTVISFVLLLGLVVETLSIYPDLFPVIGVRLGEEAGQRYGSFAMNPLALGYFASVSGSLAFCIRARPVRWITLGVSLLLLAMADSRGGMVTFMIAALIYLVLRGAPRTVSRRQRRGVRSLAVFAALVALAILLAANPRLRSIFDWTGDEGNLGRLNQWGYCLVQIADNPLRGAGAGAMSPIGIGDDPYIEEGVVKSCDSTLLKLGVEYGAWVALIYFALLVSLLARTISLMLRARDSGAREAVDAELAAAVAITCSVFLQQFLNQTLESVWIGAVFFSLLGYAFYRVSNRQPARPSTAV